MGLCVSCHATSVATAKVILQDERLQEFSYPVKVSYVLAKDPSSFLCDSEDMEFDGVLTAVHDDEELQPGQLYFALPLSKLKRPLQAEEMAALAVKANAALLKSAGGEKCRCKKKSGNGFFGGERSGKVVDGHTAIVEHVRRVSQSRNGNVRSKMFAANLSVIPE